MEQNDKNPLVTVRRTFGAGVKYLIPDYQRGYKWTVAEVRKLLEDVSTFSRQNGRDYYCLQNLTLVRSATDSCLMKVVDGQQRLTTSTLVISYLKYACSWQDLDVCMNLNFGERKKDTTQRFWEEKILNGQIWRDVDAIKQDGGLDIVKNRIWIEPHPKNLAGQLHEIFEGTELSSKLQSLDFDHSDIFHLFCAAMTVAAFVQENYAEMDAVKGFALKFLDDVRFLHNVMDESLSTGNNGASVVEAEIFSKINGFRVPLDGADLLRAIFITNVARDEAPAGEIEREVKLNEDRVRLGLELDQMNAWWHDSRHRRYFAMFDSVKDPDASFDSERYPLNLLFKLFVASEGDGAIYLDRFEHPKREKGVSELYAKILQFHAEMKDWFEDVAFYHLAGFLVAQGEMPFREIYEIRKAAPSRKELMRTMKWQIFLAVTKRKGKDFEETEKIGKDINGSDATRASLRFDELSKAIDGTVSHDWYAEETYSAKKILVLMDVIAFTAPRLFEKASDKTEEKSGKISTKMRTPLADHLDPEFFKCKDDDKEHIFPQTPIGSEVLKKIDFLKEKIGRYWDLVVTTAGGGSLTDDERKTYKSNLIKEWEAFWIEQEQRVKVCSEPFPINDINKGWFKWLLKDKTNFENTKLRLNRFVFDKCQIDINSIGNIVMLDLGINRERSYSNSHYTEKRAKILECYRRQQPVRLHTYRVFIKEFSSKSSLDVWGKDAIEANRKSIRDVIRRYFSEFLQSKGVEDHE